MANKSAYKYNPVDTLLLLYIFNSITQYSCKDYLRYKCGKIKKDDVDVNLIFKPLVQRVYQYLDKYYHTPGLIHKSKDIKRTDCDFKKFKNLFDSCRKKNGYIVPLDDPCTLRLGFMILKGKNLIHYTIRLTEIKKHVSTNFNG